MLPSSLRRWCGDAGLGAQVAGLYAVLIGANILAWIWAFAALRQSPVLIGSALLAYTLGLRHAVDADHIAAIDNSVRKLMQHGRRPVGIGVYFSLGHSTVVVVMSIVVGFTTAELSTRFEHIKALGAVVGTGVSAFFLLVLAMFNFVVLLSVYRTFVAVRRGKPFRDADLDVLLNGRGFLTRLLRPLFRLITKSWHLFLIGFLFGLGFDTATEIALLGMGVTQAAKGVSLSTLLVFPALFAAGMSIIDTTDGVLMIGVYGWAFMKPIRKLYYNLTITATSVVIATLIGGIETLGLVSDAFKLEGAFWTSIGSLNDNFGLLGYVIMGVFAASWLVSVLIYWSRNYDSIDVRRA